MKFKKKIMLMLIVTVILFVGINSIKAEYSGGGNPSGSNNGTNSSGNWCMTGSNGTGIKISVCNYNSTTKEITDCKYQNYNQDSEGKIEGIFDSKKKVSNWLSSEGTDSTKLYDALDIPYGTKEDNYETLLNLIGTNIANKNYIYIQPTFRICGGNRYTFRELFNSKGYWPGKDRSVGRLLANAASVGVKVGFYNKVDGKFENKNYENIKLKDGWGILEIKISDTKGSINIEKYEKINGKTTKNPIKGAGFKACPKKNGKVNWNDSDCSTEVFTANNGKATISNLKLGYNYAVKETTVPEGYEATDSDSIKNSGKLTSKSKASTLIFYNKKDTPPPPKEDCPTDLEKLKSDFTDLGGKQVKDIPELATELFKLYKKYNSKYNLLLNFDATDLKWITCSEKTIQTKSEFSCGNNGLQTSLIKTNGNTSGYRDYDDTTLYYTFFDDNNPIKYEFGNGSSSNWMGKGYVSSRCRYKIKSVDVNPKIIENNSKTYAGGIIWKTNDSTNPIFKLNFEVICSSYISITDNDDFTAKYNTGGLIDQLKSKLDSTYNRADSIYNNVMLEITGDKGDIATNKYVNNLNKTVLKDGFYYHSSKNKYGDYSAYYYNYEVKYSADTYWTYKDIIKFRKNSGSVTTKDNNYVVGGYGIPTSMMPVDNGKVNFKLVFKGGIANFFASNSSTTDSDWRNGELSQSTYCSYKTKSGLICIPGTGDPNCPDTTIKKKLNLKFRIIDTNSVKSAFPGITGEGRSTGNNWKDFKNIIITRNNSYNRSKKSQPLLSITLKPKNIKDIQQYNKTTNYTNFNDKDSRMKSYMTCNSNGYECKSSFVTNLLNNLYGTVSGSCETGSSRKYCVGESS